MDVREGVSAETFYGPKSAEQIRIETILSNSSESQLSKCMPSYMTQLLGPSRTWKIFRKQQEAIDFCLQRRNGLMCFAFEQNGGSRLFLVAHPKIFWALNSHRFFRNCSTYEIIQEFGVYSSNEKKFSQHIIYQIANVAFQDNYAVGNFVQMICSELIKAYDSNSAGCKGELDHVSTKYKLKSEEIIDFFVYDNKGKVKLFIDQGVYTKNRHFRLLGSTKMNKNSPLVISQNNKYKPQTKDDPNLSIFLDSLITYFSSDILKTLEHGSFEKDQNKGYQKLKRNFSAASAATCPIYPEIDKFILGIISPYGGIRRKSFFNSSSKLVYDICGYRYCDNIKRHHKSNNIMFVIDLIDLTYYQKCYDPDCAGFKSQVVKLPEEISFCLQDDSPFLSILHDELCLVQDEMLEIPEKEFNEMLHCLLDSSFH